MNPIRNVFLGGTCNESRWREDLIELYGLYTQSDDIRLNFYNPVVPDWTPECMINENYQKANCDIQLYCITPKMTGVFSIAEIVDASNKCPERLVVILMTKDGLDRFNEGQWKSLLAMKAMIEDNGCTHIYYSLKDCAVALNDIYLSVGPKCSETRY